VRTVEIAPTFEAWQAAARVLLRDGVPPAGVTWREVAAIPVIGAPAATGVRVPRQFLELARQASDASDPARWSALYRVLFRIVHERRDLLTDPGDPDVRRLKGLAAQAWREAQRSEMQEALALEQQGGGAAPFVPRGAGLDELRAAGRRCEGCDLFRHATQMVFGSGPADARIVLVGEQPGDQEDLRGAPFVGPAGEVLDRALAEVGIDRGRVYVTNAVKHFKFVERGKRRIHQTPTLTEVVACRPWLDAELEVVQPAVLGALGATAARAIFGPEFRLL
jgi:DNA polymerase